MTQSHFAERKVVDAWAEPCRHKWRAGVLSLITILSSCSLQQPPSPGAVSPGLPRIQNVPLGRADAQEPPAFVALDSIRPLIARPELAQAAAAIEHGDKSRAISAFEQALARTLPPFPERLRWHLWLAYAYQERSDCDRAMSHFVAAQQEQWPLVDYARYGFAQCQVARGQVDEALGILSSIEAERPLEISVVLMRAQVLSQTSRANEAIALWRSTLKEPGISDSERAKINLSLAEALCLQTNQVGSAGLTDASTVADAASIEANLREALTLVNEASIKQLDGVAHERATAIRQSILARLFATDAVQQQQCKVGAQIDELESLVEQREFKKAKTLAESLLIELERAGLRHSATYCRAKFAAAQAHAARGDSPAASSEFDWVAGECNDPPELAARALFLEGRRLQDARDTLNAIARFESLQSRFPTHRLADDARLRVAWAYLDLGAESKFTDLILRMPDDYPAGDMTAEGLFQLALRRLVRGDWSGAQSVLLQMGKVPTLVAKEDTEQSERQIYFLARAQYRSGEKEVALSAFEQLVRERPFSYYMLAAYSRLLELAPERAERARTTAIASCSDQPFVVPYQPQFGQPGFARALELMALGEVDKGTEELTALRLPQGIAPQMLWMTASFQAAAGALRDSQKIVKGRLRDWPRRWPVGAWEPAWKVAFPRPFLDIAIREAKRTAVPLSLIYGIMREESQFDREAVSGADAYGLMQLILPTAKNAARKLGMTADSASLKRPSLNVTIGCQVLATLLQKFENQPLMAIPAYNAGPGRPARWLKERPDMDFDVWVEAIPFSETRTYFKHVLASRATYAWLYERNSADATMKLPLRVSN